ncbi:MAG: hypothetical protein KH452_06450 [Clostridiales bacterium]|nr:hypothetical protein [Clostridiales bacterium]
MMRRDDRKRAVFCLLFFLVLCGFWIVDLLSKDRIYSEWEKRMLAQKPEMNTAGILDGSYGTAYEKWLTDQFPGRDQWVGWKTRCEILLGKKEIREIYLGKDGYLFAQSEETADWDALETQMQKLFGADAVSRIHAPHAGSVLTEQVPSPLSFPGRQDAVWKNLSDHRDEYIYFRTDHHWTMLGAYYAYEAWAKEQGLAPLPLVHMEKRILRKDFYGTHYGKIHYAKEPDQMEFYDPGTECEAVYDLGESDVTGLYQEQHLKGEDAYRFFLDGNHPVVQIKTEQQGGHLAVLKDSFANNLIPFLTAHYERITVIDPRYFRVDMGQWLQEQDVTEVLILAQDTTEAEYADGSCEVRECFSVRGEEYGGRRNKCQAFKSC